MPQRGQGSPSPGTTTARSRWRIFFFMCSLIMRAARTCLNTLRRPTASAPQVSHSTQGTACRFAPPLTAHTGNLIPRFASCFFGTDGCAHLPNARVPLSGWASFDLINVPMAICYWDYEPRLAAWDAVFSLNLATYLGGLFFFFKFQRRKQSSEHWADGTLQQCFGVSSQDFSEVLST
jgi:hypothetical protein